MAMSPAEVIGGVAAVAVSSAGGSAAPACASGASPAPAGRSTIRAVNKTNASARRTARAPLRGEPAESSARAPRNRNARLSGARAPAMNRGTSRYGTPHIRDSAGSPPGIPVSIGRKAGECAMATMISRLRDYLDERNVHYQTIHHRRDYTAQETAADTATPGSQFAKAVLFKTEDGFVMAVLPAHHKVSIEKLRAHIGCEKLRLATEDEILQAVPGLRGRRGAAVRQPLWDPGLSLQGHGDAGVDHVQRGHPRGCGAHAARRLRGVGAAEDRGLLDPAVTRFGALGAAAAVQCCRDPGDAHKSPSPGGGAFPQDCRLPCNPDTLPPVRPTQPDVHAEEPGFRRRGYGSPWSFLVSSASAGANPGRCVCCQQLDSGCRAGTHHAPQMSHF